MHRGVLTFVRWVEQHPEDLEVNAPASSSDIIALEQQLGVPLPADLRFVLARFNGGSFPSGQLLPAGVGPGSIEAAVRAFAEAVGADFLDPELLLPFHRTVEGSLLCFDRSAGPVSDTWPVVDYYEDTGETRIVYRTFDGWCRHCIAEWDSPDFGADFSLDKYLRQGERHVSIEPDVSTAHATVAHALRRAGRPADALASYLRAARCVPSLPWCDWEALKLAVLLERPVEALEAAKRLAARGPEDRWAARETTPVHVADVIARIALRTSDKKPWVRIFDQLVEQATEPAEHEHANAVRRAILAGERPPAAMHEREEPMMDEGTPVDEMWAEAQAAYLAGQLRDDDMLLDPSLARLFETHAPVALLSLRRDF